MAVIDGEEEFDTSRRMVRDLHENAGALLSLNRVIIYVKQCRAQGYS